MVWSNKPTLRFWIHGPSRLRRCSVAKRLIGRPATMDRALVRRMKRWWAAASVQLVATAAAAVATIAGTSGSPPPMTSSGSGRTANAAASPLLRPAPALTRPQGQPTHPPTPSINRCAGDLQPCRARRLPRAAPPAPPGPTTAVAPSGSRDITSTRECAGGVDLSPRGDHRKGHVDLGVG